MLAKVVFTVGQIRSAIDWYMVWTPSTAACMHGHSSHMSIDTGNYVRCYRSSGPHMLRVKHMLRTVVSSYVLSRPPVQLRPATAAQYCSNLRALRDGGVITAACMHGMLCIQASTWFNTVVPAARKPVCATCFTKPLQYRWSTEGHNVPMSVLCKRDWNPTLQWERVSEQKQSVGMQWLEYSLAGCIRQSDNENLTWFS